MRKHFAVVVNWYGPYTHEEALKMAKADYADGLYLGIGRMPRQRKYIPQYIGISNNLGARLGNHHKLPGLTSDTRFWLGEVATAEPSGKRSKTTPPSLDYAEWLHAFFLQLPLNDKKKKTPPKRPVTVLNRWWKTDYETPWIRRPHPDWPDLIDFTCTEAGCKIVWFGGKVVREKPPFLFAT